MIAKVEKMIEQCEEQTEKIPSDGSVRQMYLDIAERIIRKAVKWINSRGQTIDPVTRKQFTHADSRFPVSAAQLIRQGRCADLLDVTIRSLDYVIKEFPSCNPNKAYFYARDIALAFMCIKKFLSKSQIAEWKNVLSQYNAKALYDFDGLTGRWCNVAIYGAVGEYMLIKCGLHSCDNMDFVEGVLKSQLSAFTPLGMYRDPNCPMTYDLAVRQNLVLLLNAGYDGKYESQLREMLRKGTLTQLFYQSVSGEMPFGGRSNQFHHTEAMFCCACEYEANRYYKQGSFRLAGIIKRAARRAVESTLRWQLKGRTYRHIKNMFPLKTMHGCDAYGGVSVYSLLAANLFALAAELCNDKIAECRCPSETGGYFMEILKDFHKIFAGTENISVEIDTDGQEGFDPTGLARIHVKGYPTEMILSNGIVAEPKYIVSSRASRENFAIGPVDIAKNSKWSLADEHKAKIRVSRKTVNFDNVVFEVFYSGDRNVRQRYEIFNDSIVVTNYFKANQPAITFPIIATDGLAHSKISICERECRISYRNKKFTIVFDKGSKLKLSKSALPNRNGLYHILLAKNNDASSKKFTCRFDIAK